MEFSEHLRKMATDFKVLEDDMQKLLSNEKPDMPKRSLNSIQPRTRIYKDVAEAKRAQDDPVPDFIERKIEDILGQ